MDGLDEVPTDLLRHNVQKQLEHISKDYPKNRFILTCRTQIIGTQQLANGFDLAEVANFNLNQVQQFVQNWFKANGQSDVQAKEQWGKFDNAINKQPDLKELTGTPVLLSLMCLVLNEAEEMPSERAWLYKIGIQLLLDKWNKEKQIDGWEVGTEIYRNLSIEDKESLLIEIAARKFEDPNNFVLFDQGELADWIVQQLQLSNRVEGVAVLKAIEVQHGLLVQRTWDQWSFSHLTFQEHFTFQWLTQLSSQQLAEKIKSWHWQNVVKRLVKSQQPSDSLFRLIKQAIDLLPTPELTLQEVLRWLLQKSEAVQAHKSVTVRAFYLSRAIDLTQDRSPEHFLPLNLTFDLALDLALNLDRNSTHIFTFDLFLDLTLNDVLSPSCASTVIRKHAHTVARSCGFKFSRDLSLADALSISLTYAHKLDCDLTNKLQKLREALPALDNSNSECFQQWCQTNGSQWVQQLREVMIEHRNIGHDWQFTDEQKLQLQRYYDANKFLVELMQIDGAVSDKVRAEIEDTLLLPWSELQRRQPGTYRDLP